MTVRSFWQLKADDFVAMLMTLMTTCGGEFNRI